MSVYRFKQNAAYKNVMCAMMGLKLVYNCSFAVWLHNTLLPSVWNISAFGQCNGYKKKQIQVKPSGVCVSHSEIMIQGGDVTHSQQREKRIATRYVRFGNVIQNK